MLWRASDCANFENIFFLVYEGREDPNTTLSGPSLARQRNAVQIDDGPTLVAGLVAL